MKNFKRYLVTAALPYANGPLHIGHLAGVYIPADIYVRYLRLKKQDVLYICGSDEHGVPITLRARKEGTTPQQVVDQYHSIIEKSFQEFGISFDIYSRTSKPVHHQTASEFFKTIHEKNGFIEKTSEQYYDSEANQFLADRYIIGTCPRCANENAYGDQCEKCGTSLSPTELINPRSAISGTAPILKETSHWYLPLDEWEPFLKKWILEEHKEWKPNVYGQCKSWLDAGLLPRAVSRDLDWGVPVPLANAGSKVLYVWFDAPIGYISATKELTPDWEKYWKSEDTRLIHFIGKDNIVFHCIVFPAMLKAEGSYILPDNVPANEFLNLENEKISTSRNWAVWLHEYLADFPQRQDVLRYTLTSIAPETSDNDFTWKNFQEKNNNELVAMLGNFINRVVVLTNKYYNGNTPELGIPDAKDLEVINTLEQFKTNVEKLIEEFHFRDAQREAMNIARLGNKYLAETEPWRIFKENPEKVATILNICIQITANLSIILEPFLPFTVEKIRKILNIGTFEWNAIGSHTLVPTGHKIDAAPELLFSKIEDAEIEKQIEKLQLSKMSNAPIVPQFPPVKENIAYTDFEKLDIRIGTILEAQKVPKADKLLQFLVDSGVDKRTIVSGLALHYTPEQMVGKKVTFIANLEPRKIKGIESHGMILTAESPDGKLALLAPESEIQNGSLVK